jgi:hypothetical protein
MKLPKPTYDMPINTPLWRENMISELRAKRLRELERQKWLAVLLSIVALFSTVQFAIWVAHQF